MNLLQELQQLDPRDPGRWPLPVRVGAAALFFVALTLLLGYLLVWKDKDPQLDQKVAEEMTLRETFKSKHQKAVNLEVYQQQLKDIERSFGALLRQLPGKTEVPSLLVDISQTGLAAGLEEKLFQPENEVKKDFYAELPIKIRLTGGYHEFGEFVSGIAALPRIVTLHDIQITRPPGRGTAAAEGLQLDVTAKTYRYLEESELQEQREADTKAKSRKGRKRR